MFITVRKIFHTESKSAKYIKISSIWVKKNAYIFRVIGGVFFIFALISGILWSLGKEIEPIAYIFGLLSSLFFASPSIAEYFVPNRKSISDMDFNEILEFILNSDPKQDWKIISNNLAEEAFLKEDPRLRLHCRYDDEGIHNENFQEPWANKHPDKNATSYWYNLSYDSSLIDRYILVCVDGCRAILPLPDITTLRVKPLPYKIAEIFDSLDSLENYMNRSGLSK